MFSLESQLEQLTTKGHFWEALLENIDGGVEICTYAGGFPIRYINGGFTRLVGYTLEEIKEWFGGLHENLIHPKDREHTRQVIAQQFVDNGRCDIEYRLVRKDGGIVWVLNKGLLIQENGEQLVQCTLTDITRLKKIEQDLRISEKRYELAMNFSEVTIFDYDINTKRMHLHPGDVQEYNVPKFMDNAVETLISLGIVQPRSHRAIRRLYRRIEQGAPSASAIIHATNEAGDNQILELMLATIYDDEGQPVNAVGVRRDITETLRLKREMEYSNALVTGKQLAFEANITGDSLMKADPEWLQQLGELPIDSTFTRMIQAVCQIVVAPEHVDMVSEKLDPIFMIQEYERGERQIEIQYRRRVGDSCEWYELTLNIIKDQISGDVVVRGYLDNIEQQKQRELRAESEQQFYETMVSRSMVTYEMNLSQNRLIRGHQVLEDLGISAPNIYSSMIQEFAAAAVHPDERDGFLECFGLQNLLDNYRDGRIDTRYEYRRRDAEGRYIWVRSLAHLFPDAASRDIRGFLYVEKIDEQKKKQMELLYMAQHDMLTGLYNKTTMTELTEQLLQKEWGENALHAFFLIDLDCFKEVNDNFGHVFGDAVLARFGAKIYSLFRQGDLVGRVGGDEFSAIICSVRNREDAVAKAQEICDKVIEVYSKDGQEFRLTTSVGVAFYGTGGLTASELYLHADTALYEAKHAGRNRVVVYK